MILVDVELRTHTYLERERERERERESETEGKESGSQKRKKYNMHTSRLYEGITRELRSSNNILQISSLFK